MNPSAPGAIELLAQLVAFDSISSNSNLEFIAWIEHVLKPAGFNCRRIESQSGQKAGLVAQLGPAGDGGLVLSAHTDVVPAQGQTWTSDPFSLARRGSRLFGRGTADMKGFIACALAAACTARFTRRQRPLTLVFSYDEEVGCAGIREMMPKLLPMLARPQLCVVGEPTGLFPAIGHKGKVTCEIACHGSAGHSALAPNYTNALHIAADAVAIIRHEQAMLEAQGQHDPGFGVPYTTLHVGALSGGGPVNLVPHLARLLFECRHLAEDSPEDLIARIKSELNSRIAQHYKAPASADFRILNSYPGFGISPVHPAVEMVQQTTGEARTIKVDYGTEAGCFAAHGIPAVVCGPGSMSQGHQPDEFIEEEQLVKAFQWLDRLIAAAA